MTHVTTVWLWLRIRLFAGVHQSESFVVCASIACCRGELFVKQCVICSVS